MWDTGLAARIRAKGVRTVEIGGWQTRGNPTGFNPRGAGHHHTAGSALGIAPSLNICIYGRTDVPGPLANVLQSREPNPWNDTAYVIAAGKANHGGVGTWSGRSGTVDSNYESHGLEVEHTGMSAVSEIRHEISARILAAMIEAPGSPRDHTMVWEHFEYARPLGRKIDFRYLTPYNAAWVRGRVGFWVGRTVGQQPPPPPTPPSLEENMTFLLYHPADTFWLCMTDVPCAIQVSGDTYSKMKDSPGVNEYALSAADSDAIINRLNSTV